MLDNYHLCSYSVVVLEDNASSTNTYREVYCGEYRLLSLYTKSSASISFSIYTILHIQFHSLSVDTHNAAHSKLAIPIEYICSVSAMHWYGGLLSPEY